jgi:dihydrofolate reductase
MGRVVVVCFVSMDGVIQAPLSPEEDRDGGFRYGGWVPPHTDDVVASFMQNATTSAAGMLLGRRSYEIFHDTWAAADASQPAVAAMNTMRKYVVTSSDAPLPWANSHRVDGRLSSSVGQLRRRIAGDLVVFGGGSLLRGLAEHDLVDQYRLLLFPVVLGAGKRLFDEHGQHAAFALAASTVTSRGVVILNYDRDRSAESS